MDLGRAEVDQGRTEETFADQPCATRAAGSGVLLVERHLELERQSASAVFGGPADARPSAGGELSFPGHPLLDERMLVARAPSVSQLCELTCEVLGHPVPDLLAERGFADRGTAGHGLDATSI